MSSILKLRPEYSVWLQFHYICIRRDFVTVRCFSIVNIDQYWLCNIHKTKYLGDTFPRRGITIRSLDCLVKRKSRLTTKKTSKFCIADPLCWASTGRFHAQKINNAECVSMPWWHHMVLFIDSVLRQVEFFFTELRVMQRLMQIFHNLWECRCLLVQRDESCVIHV